MSDTLTFEQRVLVVKQFLASIGPDKAAEFVAHLQDANEGLSANMRDYEKHLFAMHRSRTEEKL